MRLPGGLLRHVVQSSRGYGRLNFEISTVRLTGGGGVVRKWLLKPNQVVDESLERVKNIEEDSAPQKEIVSCVPESGGLE